MKDLEKLRASIDELDAQILGLLKGYCPKA